MNTNDIQQLTELFEERAHHTDDGVEFWLARDLQNLLGYTKWDNFLNVLSKAKTACDASGNSIPDHFADVGKMVIRRYRTTHKFKTANNTKRLISQLADNLAALSRLKQDVRNNLKGLGYEW